MSSIKPQTPLTPPGTVTGLVDRMNVAVHFRRYFKLLARRWFILLGTVLLCAGYYSYKAYTSPDIYEARSVIGIAARVQTGLATPVVLEEMSAYRENQIQIMGSSAVQKRVREKIASTNALALTSITSAAPQRGAGSSFNLVVQATSLDAARLYAKTWAEEFMRYKEEQNAQKLGRSALELQQNLVTFEKKLEQVRRDRDHFIRTNNIASIKETGDAAQMRLDKLVADQASLRAQAQLLENKSVEDYAASASPESQANLPSSRSPTDTADPLTKFTRGGNYAALRMDLRKKETEKQRLEPVLRPQHPYMLQLTGEIQARQQELSSLLAFLEEERLARIASLKQEAQALQPLIDEQRLELGGSRKLQREYDRLLTEEGEVQNQLNLLRSELIKFERIDNEEQFELREAVTGPQSPVAPNRPKMVITGILAGMAFGFGIIYFLHRLDDRLEIAQDIESALDEPVLGQIPLVQLKGAPQTRLLIPNMDPHDFFAESIRGIRSAVLFGSQAGTKQVLLVSSAVPGDGKTTFTVNFAITLAMAGHKVLLIDADLRRGNIHNFFEKVREPGLSEVLSGELHWLDVMHETAVKGLQVISTGLLPNNPGELLISPVTQQLVHEVREQYDYVIFDCPPLTAIDDTFSLLGLSDGLLFVVRAGQTSMRFAQTALNAVRHRGAKIIGLVLNGITMDNPYYYYYSYYHTYYNKGSIAPPSSRSGVGPAVRMAQPKPRSIVADPSIEAQAKAHAAKKAAQFDPLQAEDVLDKTEFYRRRRAARRESEQTELHSKQEASKRGQD